MCKVQCVYRFFKKIKTLRTTYFIEITVHQIIVIWDFFFLSFTAVVKDYYQHKACLYSNYLVNKLACHYFSSQLQAA